MKTSLTWINRVMCRLPVMVFLTLLTTGISLAAANSLSPKQLRCEYLENPLGLETTNPRLSWIVTSSERGQKQTAYQILVASSESLLGRNQGDLWDSGKVLSDQTVLVAYQGSPLRSETQCFWKVRAWDVNDQPSAWSEPAFWTMGLLKPEEWSAAKWIGEAKRAPGFQPDSSTNNVSQSKWILPPSPYLRREFTVAKPVRRAVLYATALGAYELHLNGARVGQDYFNPGWTEFRKRVYYQTYDVTRMLRQGDNALGAILSDGWYSGYIWAGRDTYGTVPKLRLQLRMEYADGTQETVATDETWKYSYGPICEGDVQQGETYDARLEMPGWDAASFRDSTWQPVTVAVVTNLVLGVSPGAPVRKQKEIKPVKLTEPRSGVYVFNLGQNIAGWVRLQAKGPRGTRIVLRISGWLNPDGTIYTNYLRDARAIDTYYLKGGGRETWEPSTTYHGFQYVEVTGYPGIPSLDDLTGIECSSTLSTTGTFTCSEDRVNKFYTNSLWTMRDNLVDVPTGDSDRAERLGWCAKTPLVTTWMYALGMGGFSSKWMVDLVDSQSLGANESGAAFMQVAPFWGDIESPGWSDDGISVPYGLYQAYGDTAIIRKHYDAMARYIGYLQSKLVNNLRPANLRIAADTNFVGYGDWLAITQNREGNADIFNTLLNGASVKMMAEMAEANGRTADAAAYRTLFANMQTAFDHAYVSPGGVVRDDSQMEYALALYYGFIPTNKIPMAISHLADDILNKSHQQTWADALGKNPVIPPGHLTTGFHGSRALLPVLSQNGRNDLAYELLLTDTYPSWLYPVKLGATTTWERWDGWTPDKGFQDARMNSFSMPDLMASLDEWLFQYVGGIGQQGVGFKNIVIKPYVGPGLTWAQATYDSIHGTISVRWEKAGAALRVNVTIPANTSATVSLPGSGTGPFKIQESGKRVWTNGAYHSGVAGISGASQNGNRIDICVGSGSYQFRVEGGGL